MQDTPPGLHLQVLCPCRQGRVTPYFGMVGRFHGDNPVFEIFDQIGSLFYAPTLIDSPFLLKNIGLSLSHLVPEIPRPKLGLRFHQNVLLNSF